MGETNLKAELRCATMDNGAEFVMIAGTEQRQRLCASSSIIPVCGGVSVHVGTHVCLCVCVFSLPFLSLGGPGFSMHLSGNYLFGSGIDYFLLDNLACSGTESNLLQCPGSRIGVHNCFAYEHAGVICTGESFYFLFFLLFPTCILQQLSHSLLRFLIYLIPKSYHHPHNS